MATLDIFNNNAFATTTLTAAIEKRPYQPMLLGQMNIFEDMPVRTRTFGVEERSGVLVLVPVTPVGAPPTERTRETRTLRQFSTHRIAKADTLYSEELQGVREFGTESELMQVQKEVARRLDGPTGIRRDIELTWEYHRLGAVQGIVLDADGTTTLFNWFSEFDITPPAEIDFDLDNPNPASGAVRKLCNSVQRTMADKSQGAWVDGITRIGALCGNNFFDDLTAHPEVRQTYLNTAQAADLRDTVGRPFSTFRFGDIDWINYRGSSNSTVAIGTDKVQFFPIGAPGVFRRVLSPAEFMPWVNTPGKPEYALVIPDQQRQAWTRIEVYSYFAMVCTRPEMLLKGKRT